MISAFIKTWLDPHHPTTITPRKRETTAQLIGWHWFDTVADGLERSLAISSSHPWRPTWAGCLSGRSYQWLHFFAWRCVWDFKRFPVTGLIVCLPSQWGFDWVTVPCVRGMRASSWSIEYEQPTSLADEIESIGSWLLHGASRGSGSCYIRAGYTLDRQAKRGKTMDHRLGSGFSQEIVDAARCRTWLQWEKAFYVLEVYCLQKNGFCSSLSPQHKILCRNV